MLAQLFGFSMGKKQKEVVEEEEAEEVEETRLSFGFVNEDVVSVSIYLLDLIGYRPSG